MCYTAIRPRFYHGDVRIFCRVFVEGNPFTYPPGHLIGFVTHILLFNSFSVAQAPFLSSMKTQQMTSIP